MTYGLTSVEFLSDLAPRGAAVRDDRARASGHGTRFVPWAPLSRMLRARFATSLYEPIEPDPIDHPAFRGMSQRDLADLPFPRYAPAGTAQASEVGDVAPKPPAA